MCFIYARWKGRGSHFDIIKLSLEIVVNVSWIMSSICISDIGSYVGLGPFPHILLTRTLFIATTQTFRRCTANISLDLGK